MYTNTHKQKWLLPLPVFKADLGGVGLNSIIRASHLPWAHYSICKHHSCLLRHMFCIHVQVRTLRLMKVINHPQAGISLKGEKGVVAWQLLGSIWVAGCVRFGASNLLSLSPDSSPPPSSASWWLLGTVKSGSEPRSPQWQSLCFPPPFNLLRALHSVEGKLRMGTVQWPSHASYFHSARPVWSWERMFPPRACFFSCKIGVWLRVPETLPMADGLIIGITWKHILKIKI